MTPSSTIGTGGSFSSDITRASLEAGLGLDGGDRGSRDMRLQSRDMRLQSRESRLQSRDGRPKSADGRPKSADGRPPRPPSTDGRLLLSVEGKATGLDDRRFSFGSIDGNDRLTIETTGTGTVSTSVLDAKSTSTTSVVSIDQGSSSTMIRELDGRSLGSVVVELGRPAPASVVVEGGGGRPQGINEWRWNRDGGSRPINPVEKLTICAAGSGRTIIGGDGRPRSGDGRRRSRDGRVIRNNRGGGIGIGVGSIGIGQTSAGSVSIAVGGVSGGVTVVGAGSSEGDHNKRALSDSSGRISNAQMDDHDDHHHHRMSSVSDGVLEEHALLGVPAASTVTAMMMAGDSHV